MKIIKFDLPINGIKAKNLEELRDNLTDEIAGLARSGQLARWFISRQWEDKAKAVAAAVLSAPEDKALFLALCEILETEIHPDDVNAIFDAPPPAGCFIKDARYFELYEASKNYIKDLEIKIENLNSANISNTPRNGVDVVGALNNLNKELEEMNKRHAEERKKRQAAREQREKS